MKLFVIAALVAVAAAGRLEHLERSYLPPDNNAISSARSSFGSNGGFSSPSSHGSFGSPSSHGGFGSISSHGGFGSTSSHGSFSSPSSHGSFGPNSGAFGAAGSGLQRLNAAASFAGATSNQYLPPNQRSAASNGAPQFGGSIQGFGPQNYRSQQYNRQVAPTQQYTVPSTQYGSPQTANTPNYQAQYPQQSAATSRQYLAPRTGSSQNSQQAFDEQTGYQYGAPQATSSISGPRYQGQFPQQSAAASRQYLAPRTSSFQKPSQQAFDEQTGYQY